MATNDLQVPAKTAAPVPAPAAGSGGGKAASSGDGTFKPFGEDGFTFADLLDIVNPLQHIPIVGSIYRHLTGDTIDPAARLAGGALFGGAIGVVLAGANAAIEDATGKDMGEQVIALFSGEAGEAPATAVAEAAAPADPAANAGALPPVPDLALLGPLGPLPTPAVAGPPALPADQAAAPSSPVPATAPVVDLAALAPLLPMAETPAAGTAVAAASVEAPPAPPTRTPAPERPAAAPSAASRLAVAQATGTVPHGAPAADGGWFSQVMLTALEKYEKAAKLSEAGPETAALAVPN